MNSKFILLSLCAALLAGCGGTSVGGRPITDGSGNPVRIGDPENASGGPSSPGWPTYTPSQAGR
ncbi:MAG TPA: hypothetical protein VG873_03495 [Burkholderiales bacterium]|jgi:hypothetical protein|nr:hypothetical protein [Burkholderiales bacterium]